MFMFIESCMIGITLIIVYVCVMIVIATIPYSNGSQTTASKINTRKVRKAVCRAKEAYPNAALYYSHNGNIFNEQLIAMRVCRIIAHAAETDQDIAIIDLDQI